MRIRPVAEEGEPVSVVASTQSRLANNIEGQQYENSQFLPRDNQTPPGSCYRTRSECQLRPNRSAHHRRIACSGKPHGRLAFSQYGAERVPRSSANPAQSTQRPGPHAREELDEAAEWPEQNRTS